MGPLATMFAGLKQQNDADFGNYRRSHPGFGDDDYSRALFNSRLSRLSDVFHGGRMPDDDGGPIILGDRMPRANPFINPMLDDSAPLMDRTTFDRTPSFRDPGQGGPSPPVNPGILAAMFGGK